MAPVSSETSFKGVAVAVVTDNKDPDDLCRVKVRYPWHDRPRKTYWARLAVPMAGNDRGVVLVPEVGDEVLVALSAGTFALRTCSVRSGMAKASRRSPTPMARTTSESSSRERGTSCCSMTARAVSSRWRMSTAEVVFDDDGGIRVEDADSDGSRSTVPVAR